MPQHNLKNKVAIVTGASRGIGYATALELAKQGAHVIAIARTIGGLEELDDAIQKIGGTATLVPLDITDTTKLQALGPSLVSRFKQVDIVVAAAGYLSKLTPIAQSPTDHWNRAIATNATANVHLIQTLHPLLKQASDARVVFLTDDSGENKPYWGFYAASKAALKSVVASYAAENPEMTITTFTPKATQTRLREEAYPGRKDGQTTKQAAQEIFAFLTKIEKKAA